MRRRKRCRIGFNPQNIYFKPAGIRKKNLEEIVLTSAELEAVRLKDVLDMDQNEAAMQMEISQPLEQLPC